MLEFERNGRKVLRVSAIRNSEELISWEVLDTCKGPQYCESMSNSNLHTFRWPYFAYSDGGMRIYITPLADKDYVIYHELPNADEGHIQRMDFST